MDEGTGYFKRLDIDTGSKLFRSYGPMRVGFTHS